MLFWREAISISGPMVQIVVPSLDRIQKIFFGPATLHHATLHNVLHYIVKDCLKAALAPNKCAYLVVS